MVFLCVASPFGQFPGHLPSFQKFSFMFAFATVLYLVVANIELCFHLFVYCIFYCVLGYHFVFRTTLFSLVIFSSVGDIVSHFVCTSNSSFFLFCLILLLPSLPSLNAVSQAWKLMNIVFTPP